MTLGGRLGAKVSANFLPTFAGCWLFLIPPSLVYDDIDTMCVGQLVQIKQSGFLSPTKWQPIESEEAPSAKVYLVL